MTLSEQRALWLALWEWRKVMWERYQGRGLWGFISARHDLIQRWPREPRIRRKTP